LGLASNRYQDGRRLLEILQKGAALAAEPAIEPAKG
jgi:hypothetical protein